METYQKSPDPSLHMYDTESGVGWVWLAGLQRQRRHFKSGQATAYKRGGGSTDRQCAALKKNQNAAIQETSQLKKNKSWQFRTFQTLVVYALAYWTTASSRISIVAARRIYTHVHLQHVVPIQSGRAAPGSWSAGKRAQTIYEKRTYTQGKGELAWDTWPNHLVLRLSLQSGNETNNPLKSGPAKAGPAGPVTPPLDYMHNCIAVT